MEFLRPRKEWEISHNAKIKTYPDYYIISICSASCYRDAGLELSGWSDEKTSSRRSAGGLRAKAESLRRARQKIKDIALCTEFTHFVTLTLDKEKIDRYDYKEIVKKMRVFLSNAVERKGFCYLLVPEFHKDGAVHFHGLYRSERGMGEVGSGKRTKAGQEIFNLSSWKFGFSTSIPLQGNYERVVSYILKYIRKDSEKVGGRWYLSGGDIKRPDERLADLPYHAFDVDEFVVPDVNFKFKYLKIPREDFDEFCNQHF